MGDGHNGTLAQTLGQLLCSGAQCRKIHPLAEQKMYLRRRRVMTQTRRVILVVRWGSMANWLRRGNLSAFYLGAVLFNSTKDQRCDNLVSS